ncbi:hypothetical protein ABXR19_17915 [Uliginosibacterium flavum]|uniref:Formylmethanofuran dehydrogenase subunit E domain-containing protein n=1 Tax=Uliginosibacterium flavum TaxID=1396831 RepID=A0ABV2TQ65_9RHOO
MVVTKTNEWPDFFTQVPRIQLRDPLADLLGSVKGGVIEYGYADAVAMTGHSCPTVAAAYWLTVCALRALYQTEMPQRGGIRVMVRGPAYEGVSGVQASVISLITGAAPVTGFRGIGGKHQRANLLMFDAKIPAPFRFERLDTGDAVYAQARMDVVSISSECSLLLQRCLADVADEHERQRFRELWQARVRSLLLDYGDDHEVFEIRPVFEIDPVG